MVRAMALLLLVVMAATGTRTGAEGEGVTGGVEVETRLGSVRGVVSQAGPGKHYYSFRGIPYAKPPLADLRFKDPVPAEAWSGVRENFEPPLCPQISMKYFFTREITVVGDDDCLYLHVYTPTVEKAELPVMVFIHGGGYVLGGPDITGGSPLHFMTRDVVFVAMQYRLGTLGFISTEDEVMPGNLGLKDQTLALRWVQDNIIKFGGDPAKVTIFGSDAGGSSVHLQMFTPSAAGLFQRSIMESGNALGSWKLRDDHREMAGKVGLILGCTGLKDEAGALDSQALLACLQQAPVDKLVMAQVPAELWNSLPIYMVPRVDGEYLPAHPAQLLREGRYSKVDMISGVCSHEGGRLAVGAIETPEGERLEPNFDRFGPIAMALYGEAEGVYMARRIFYHYLGSGSINFTRDNADTVERMAGDVYINVPHDVVSQFHARDAIYGRKVYTYQFNHLGPYNFLEKMYNTTLAKNWVFSGAELIYMFDDLTMDIPPLERPEDLVMQDIMLDLWTNFAATGNPTPDLSLGFKWSPASTSNLQHLSLTPAPTMRPDHRAQTREFLLDLPTKENKLLFPDKFHPDVTTTSGYCHA